MAYIKPGNYKARAVASECGIAQNGNPFLKVTFQLEDGERIDWFGRPSTPKGEEYMVKDLRTLGYAGSDPEELHAKNSDDLATLLPNEVSLKIEDDEWNGNVRSRVRYINSATRELPAGGGLFSSMKAAFAANPAGGKAAAKPAGKPAPLARPAPAPVAEVLEDDVPFLAGTSLQPRSPGAARKGGPGMGR
jgi:hypothetical protein